MNRKPYKNKSDYDPGRFRNLLVFKEQQTITTEFGGSIISLVDVYTCKGIELQVNDSDQLVITAGASRMNMDKWFVIRFWSEFTPLKDMNITEGGNKYVIRAVVPVDNPIKYYKILAVRQDG